MAFDSNRSGISITIGSIGSYIHIGIYCLRVSILTFIFVIDRVYEPTIKVNEFLLFISRYRVGLFRRLREAATEKDIHKAAREVIALVCTSKCIYFFIHFVLIDSFCYKFVQKL